MLDVDHLAEPLEDQLLVHRAMPMPLSSTAIR